MTAAAHFRRFPVRRRSAALVNSQDLVVAMTIAATRGIDETGQQQGLAVLTGQVAINELDWVIVARATVLNLVDGRYSRCKIGDFVNFVRRTVAVVTGGFTAVRAASDRPLHFAVTLATALVVCQRLEVFGLMRRRDVRMAFGTRYIRMCR
jgi:hypothetical protein